jgi:superfamily II DNA or RNA helicase
MSKNYPSIKDNDFNNEINNKYKKYVIPNNKPSFNNICYPTEYKLQVQQQFLSKYINPDSPYKGVLVFHRIGAGKTCTAVNIAEQWKSKRKIIVVTPASLVGNFRDELRSPCAKNTYLSNSERTKLSKLHPGSDEYKQIIDISDKRINKFYNIYSYNKFVELAEEKAISLNNAILIIDEIQNMVSESGKYYNVLYNTIHEAPSNLRVVLLSATPMFDKPVEIALTMNLLRIPFEFPEGREFEKMFIKTLQNKKNQKTYQIAKNLDKFKEMIRGYVSYYRGAPEIAFPEAKINYVKCEMSDFQYRSYLTVLKNEEKSNNMPLSRIRAFQYGDVEKLPNNFFIGTRLISNVSFPNRGINEDGFRSFKGKNLDWDNLKKFSIKFYKILKAVGRSTGPVFIYSNFKEYGGLKSLVAVLEHHGYLNYSKYGEGKKRFALWTGDEKQEVREEAKAVFNQAGNVNGSKIRIFLGSSATKEGLSFKNVKQIHILEPYWNQARMSQIIGRGVRYCSHKQLEPEDRNVKVYIYLAVRDEILETVDQHIAKMAERKDKLIQEFELAMKNIAVDCALFKHGNRLAGDNDITCDI